MSQMRFALERGIRVRVLVLAAAGVALAASLALGLGAPPSKAASKSPVKVMFIMPDSSSASTVVFPEGSQVAKAFAANLNAHGGINGHKVDVIYCNDQDDPNQASACARQAASDHVVAATGFTVNGAVIQPILQKEGIAWLTEAAQTPQENTGSNVFPVSSGSEAELGMGIVAASKCKSVWGVQVQYPGDALNLHLEELGVAAGGKPGLISASRQTTYAGTTTDFAPIVAQVMANHPSCLLMPLSPTDSLRFALALKQGGYPHVTFVVPDDGAINTSAISQTSPVENGAWVVAASSPYSDKGWSDYRAAVKKYAKAGLEYQGFIPKASWIAMLVTTEVAGQVKGQLTAASMLAQLRKSSSVSTQGKGPALNFTKQLKVKGYNRFFDNWVWYDTVKNGNLVGAFNNKATDLTPAWLGQHVKLP